MFRPYTTTGSMFIEIIMASAQTNLDIRHSCSEHQATHQENTLNVEKSVIIQGLANIEGLTCCDLNSSETSGSSCDKIPRFTTCKLRQGVAGASPRQKKKIMNCRWSNHASKSNRARAPAKQLWTCTPLFVKSQSWQKHFPQLCWLVVQ